MLFLICKFFIIFVLGFFGVDLGFYPNSGKLGKLFLLKEVGVASINRIKNILAIGRDTYWVLLVYGISVSILSLIIPIAAQVLVNIVSFGTLVQPLIILTVIVFLMLASSAVLRIFQASLVEMIQQRIFTQVALQLAERLPRTQLSAFHQKRRVEWVNRFFDVFLVQKSVAGLLISGLDVLLQAIISMLLLAFYHPILLAFDICLMIALAFALWLPWKGGLESALQESQEKYEVAGWLEELLHNLTLFKVHNNVEFALKKADEKIVNYLLARKKHFKYLLYHFCGTYGIYVVASAALLGIGGYLVMRQQLTLGQLVAAEIMLSYLVSGIVSLGRYLENIYDLLASSEKVGTLLDLPIEEPIEASSQSLMDLNQSLKNPPHIQVEQLSYETPAQYSILNQVEFEVLSGDACAIIGGKGTGKSLLINLILGLIPLQKGIIKFNQLPIQEFPAYHLRDHFSLIKGTEIFTGTILENLVLHQQDLSLEKIYSLLKSFDLFERITQLPEGLNTILPGNFRIFSTTELQKLMFVRALLAKPSLLLIDGALDQMAQQDVDLILGILSERKGKFTLIVTTRREDIANHFNYKVVL